MTASGTTISGLRGVSRNGTPLAISCWPRSAASARGPTGAFKSVASVDATPAINTTIGDSTVGSRMERGGGDGKGHPGDPSSNPNVDRVRELMASHDHHADGWEKCWEEGLTPWDLGQPTPVVQHLVQMGTLPKGRVLVPGCGTGYDVVAMASPERYVVGLDISDSAVKKAKERSSSLPNANYFTFLVADFFSWQPTELFDLIFDYTFFCAIDPCMRSAWAEKIRDWLKPDGELITLIFLISCQDGGPPYNTSVADYEEVLNPMGFKALSTVDNELAAENRKGREKLIRWKRCPDQSSCE